jgi:pyruvate,water dikinase
METCIKKYTEIGIKDIGEVGYKNASIGKTMHHLAHNGVLTPAGFAITASAYRHFISENKLELPLKYLMAALDTKDYTNLEELSGRARKIIMDGRMPTELGLEIMDAYDYLFDLTEAAVAVRSSAVSDHLADAAAIGLNHSIFNVKGHCALLYAIRQCFASLYSDKAVRHAAEKGYDPCAAAMSIAIQQMVRADKGCSGVGYTHDPRTNVKDTIYIKAILGLGELINRISVKTDEYRVSKHSLQTSTLLVEKARGDQQQIMVFADEDDETNQTVLKDIPKGLQQGYVLNDKEIRRLAEWGLLLDDVYKNPVCFEWAKDGENHQLYLIQVSPAPSQNHPANL